MAFEIRNTKDLVDPSKLKIKMLVYSQPGLGKTLFAGTADNSGIAACETGHGNGQLTIASQARDYITPKDIGEFEAFCAGRVFPDKDVQILDSLSSMCKTFVKDYALTLPRSRGNSDKRALGIPELDDYGSMGEITRRLVAKLLAQDKHVIVTATEKIDKPDESNGQGEFTIGPDLPGQMFLGSTAMFDFVLRLRVRPKLRDPKDAKSRYAERYFITQPAGDGCIVKCRSNDFGIPLLDKEEIFEIHEDENGKLTGTGTFPYLRDKILAGYARAFEKLKGRTAGA